MKRIVWIIALAMGFASCETVVELDLPESDPLLVVESQITNRSRPFEVQLSLTQPFNDQSPFDPVASAEVTITSTDGTVYELEHQGKGLFATQTHVQAMVGESYTLNIKYGGKEYTATERCKPQIQIDTLLAFFLPDQNGFIEPGFYAFIGSGEWEEPGDFYEWKIYKNDTLLDDFGPLVDSDEFREASFFNLNIDPNDPLANFPEVQPRPFPFTFEEGDTVRVVQYNISQEYYDFLLEITAQLSRAGTPFDPPPANPRTNITGAEALGFFSVANEQSIQVVVE
jgi:hypothetical protein